MKVFFTTIFTIIFSIYFICKSQTIEVNSYNKEKANIYNEILVDSILTKNDSNKVNSKISTYINKTSPKSKDTTYSTKSYYKILKDSVLIINDSNKIKSKIANAIYFTIKPKLDSIWEIELKFNYHTNIKSNDTTDFPINYDKRSNRYIQILRDSVLIINDTNKIMSQIDNTIYLSIKPKLEFIWEIKFKFIYPENPKSNDTIYSEKNYDKKSTSYIKNLRDSVLIVNDSKKIKSEIANNFYLNIKPIHNIIYTIDLSYQSIYLDNIRASRADYESIILDEKFKTSTQQIKTKDSDKFDEVSSSTKKTIIFTLLGVYIFVLLITISIKIINIYKFKKTEKIQKKFKDLVFEYLFTEIKDSDLITKFTINSFLKRKIAIHILLEIINSLKGEYIDKIFDLYNILEFKKSLKKIIKTKKSSTNIVEIIIEISVFKHIEFEDYLLKLTSNKNVTIRQNSKLSLLSLDLDKYKKFRNSDELTNYEKLQITLNKNK